MKSIIRVALIALALAFVSPVSFAEETKAAPKVEVKAPASQPVAATAAAKTDAVAVPVAAVSKTAAPAPEPTVSEWWKVLIRYGLELAFTVLGLLASVLVTVLMKKYGFESYTTKLDDLLSRGIGYAEQMSLKALKLNGQPLGSAEKLELALKFVSDKAKEYKLPDKGREWWTQKVEGWLGMQKVQNGSSATTNG